MAKARTVSELTSSRYTELVYNSAPGEDDGPVKGGFVKKVCRILGKCGIDIEEANVYGMEVAIAVARFQEMAGMDPTGILNDKTFSAMNAYADMKMTDIIIDEEDEEDGTTESESLYPHFDSYFKEKRFRIYRQNHKDIKIVFGNSTIAKTIKDVFMRSVTMEVDTSGNPVSEVYEFIARDVVESDEISDKGKYATPESYAPADIKYNFDNLFKKKTVSEPDKGTGTSSSTATGHSSGGGRIHKPFSSGGGIELDKVLPAPEPPAVPETPSPEHPEPSPGPAPSTAPGH